MILPKQHGLIVHTLEQRHTATKPIIKNKDTQKILFHPYAL